MSEKQQSSESSAVAGLVLRIGEEEALVAWGDFAFASGVGSGAKGACGVGAWADR